MQITFYCPGAPIDLWKAAFLKHCPQAVFKAWQAGDAPADYGIVWHPSAQFFAEQTQLKTVFNIGAGVDAILKQKCLPANLPIVKLEDAGMADQMFDYILYAVLHYFRNMDGYGFQQTNRVWNALPAGNKAADFVVGVMGLGQIGQNVAQRLAAYGFTVHGWSRSEKSLPGIYTHAGMDALADFLGALDTVVLVLPHTPATHGILNKQRLGQIKPGAAIINVGRGDLLSAPALLEALNTGHLRGAFLDVFEVEPLPADSQLWTHPKIRLTPHISAPTLIEPSMAQIAQKILLLEAGKPISGIVNPNLGY